MTNLASIAGTILVQDDHIKTRGTTFPEGLVRGYLYPLHYSHLPSSALRTKTTEMIQLPDGDKTKLVVEAHNVPIHVQVRLLPSEVEYESN